MAYVRGTMSATPTTRVPGRVSVVIPAYNCAGFLANCLESIAAQSHREFDVIVVDNGSTDGTGDVARAFEGRLALRVVRLDPNRGFTGGSNAGLDAATGEFVLLLNSDVELDPEFLREGVRAMIADPRCGAAGGPVYDLLPTGRSQTRQSNGHYLAAVYQLRSYPAEAMFDGRRIFGPSATSVMLRAEAIDDVRLANGQVLDEQFWCNGEDIDLWMRLLHRGWTARYAERAVCWHQGSMAFGGSMRLWTKSYDVQRIAVRNHYYVLVGDYPLGLLLADLPAIVAADLGASVLWGLKNPKTFAAFTAAKWNALLDLPYMLRKRRELFARSKVSGGEIRRFFFDERAAHRVDERLEPSQPA